MKHKNNIIWLDLEMSGLHPDKDVILEVAAIATDAQLNVLAELPSIVIHHEQTVLDNMDEWCTNQHKKSGLSNAVIQSTTTLAECEKKLFDFIKKYTPKDEAVLAGNSIWQDRVFIRKYMPEVYDYLHYKMIDVSSIKELLKRWYPTNPNVDFKKHDTHRALTDITESIEQLKNYQQHFFIPPHLISRPE